MNPSVWEESQPTPAKRVQRAELPSEFDDRLPPFSSDTEAAALGCMMIDPKSVIPQAIEKFPSPEVFYDLKHLTVYETILALYDSREGIDIITIQARLKSDEMLDQVGGLVFLSTLMESAPSSANFSYYAEIVLEKWQLRKLLKVSYETSRGVYDEMESVPKFVEKVAIDFEAAISLNQRKPIRSIQEIVRQSLDEIETAIEQRKSITGIATGFTDFDRLTSGLQPSNMVIIAARPSMGKTALAMNIAENVAIDQGIPVGIFSLEMTSESLVKRMISSRARVNSQDIRDGSISASEIPKITSASGRIANSPIFIEDSPNMTLLQFKARARRFVEVNGCRLLIIDYLQLLKLGKKTLNRQEEVTHLSNGIKSTSKELNVPIIVLSQLNRELEKEGSKRKPRLSDIRESGALEQDADLVGLLYKPQLLEDEEPDYESSAIPVNLLIAKQRNGPTGDVNLVFMRSFTRFENAARIPFADDPSSVQSSLNI